MKKSIIRCLEIAKTLIEHSEKYINLRANQFCVDFIHEGGFSMRLPKSNFFASMFLRGSSSYKNLLMASRPNSEVLFRRLIYDLYKSNLIASNRSIIDIGCWISDNAIVWSTYIESESTVYAIDPAENNLKYGQNVAKSNERPNIRWVKAVCSERPGDRLGYSGNLDHTSFSPSATKNTIFSSTLDQIIAEDGEKPIGFIHVDVEGLELSVLKGASNIISKDRPIIAFEQHISTENVMLVVDFLRTHHYRVYMVNEVLPGCNLDCRNFLAFPSDLKPTHFRTFAQQEASAIGIFSAAIGGQLIEI